MGREREDVRRREVERMLAREHKRMHSQVSSTGGFGIHIYIYIYIFKCALVVFALGGGWLGVVVAVLIVRVGVVCCCW